MNRKRPTRRYSQSYESLEPRQLLAGITFDSGNVVVNGNPTDDVIELIGSSDFQSFTVRINNDASLTESFDYSDVTSLTVFAGNGNDRVTNTLLIDTSIFGGSGNDNLQGGYRNDQLSGGNGVDTLIGRNGNDTLRGEGGKDSLFSGNGDDVLIGGLDDDLLNGSSGDDVLNGNGGNDTIIAGLGDDTSNGGTGDDRILGVDGTNRLNGNGGNDRIFGGDGEDEIWGGSEDDLIAGNNGNDRLLGNEGVDQLFGGFGNDNLIGGTGDDSLYGQQGDDVLSGERGNDLLVGFDGDDFFNGADGDDTIRGGNGLDLASYTASQFDLQIDSVGGSYRVTDFRIPGLISVGNDLLNDIEDLNFIGALGIPIDDAVFRAVDRRITVQPIVTADDDGSNAANGFGSAEEEAEIKHRVVRIYNQAGIDVEFLPTKQWNSTFANGNGTGDRDVTDFQQIISQGDAAGFGSSDPTVIDLYFLSRTPGFSDPNVTGNVASHGGGRGYLGLSGSVLTVGDLGTRSSSGRDVVAEVIAHEFGHNLGLSHSGASTLMSPTADAKILLQGQIGISRQSFLTQPISGSSNEATTAGSSGTTLADPGGCGCGVCGVCTGAATA